MTEFIITEIPKSMQRAFLDIVELIPLPIVDEMHVAAEVRFLYGVVGEIFADLRVGIPEYMTVYDSIYRTYESMFQDFELAEDELDVWVNAVKTWITVERNLLQEHYTNASKKLHPDVRYMVDHNFTTLNFILWVKDP